MKSSRHVGFSTVCVWGHMPDILFPWEESLAMIEQVSGCNAENQTHASSGAAL